MEERVGRIVGMEEDGLEKALKNLKQQFSFPRLFLTLPSGSGGFQIYSGMLLRKVLVGISSRCLLDSKFGDIIFMRPTCQFHPDNEQFLADALYGREVVLKIAGIKVHQVRGKIEHQLASGTIEPFRDSVWKGYEITMYFVTWFPLTQRKHDADPGFARGKLWEPGHQVLVSAFPPDTLDGTAESDASNIRGYLTSSVAMEESLRKLQTRQKSYADRQRRA
ncbi:hypothetical protein Tco_0405823 [Tanacetum coccineum]